MSHRFIVALTAVAVTLPLHAEAACPTGTLTHCSLSISEPLFECTLPNATERSEGYFWLDDGKICVQINDGGTIVSTETLDPSALTVPPSSSQNLILTVTGTNSGDLIQFWNPGQTVSLGDPSGRGLRARAFGGDGADEIVGGDGDVISYQDDLFGEDGDDHIWTNDGFDLAEGGDGNDRIEGGDYTQFIVGGDGNDVIWGRADRDDIQGDDPYDNTAAGSDKINGGDEHDYIYGGPGGDQLCGDDLVVLTGTNPHNEWLYGEDGTDCLAAGTGGPSGGLGLDQRIDCGSGTDTYQSGSYVSPTDCETIDSSGLAYCDDSTW